MPISRRFLSCDRPGLVAGADYLVGEYQRDDALALDGVIIVVPGRRAGRRLLEILLRKAGEQNLGFMPPRIVTGGTLPELLYEAKRPFADDATQLLAWVGALREANPDVLLQVFPAHPGPTDTIDWLPFANELLSLHRELAGDGLTFEDVAERGPALTDFREERRWRALRRIQRAYLTLLDELEVWDIQTARLYAVEKRECRTEHDVVLLGTVDMNRTLRQMIDQVADHVTVLVHAPESWEDRFDAYGCLVPDAWSEVTIDLADDQIRMADDPQDQAEHVLRRIAAYDGRFAVDEITIGVPDEGVVRDLQSELAKYDLKTRWPVGRNLSETAPYRLLSALGSYLSSERADDWAAIVRHPDVHRWLGRQGVDGDWLSELDGYRTEFLATKLRQNHLNQVRHSPRLAFAHQQIASLLKHVRSDELREPADWATALADVLCEVYREEVLDRDNPTDQMTIAACGQVSNGLRQLTQLVKGVVPEVRVSDAIALLLELLAGDTVPAPTRSDAIEMLGWLELPLDDAPALIVTSMNDGVVPSSRLGDLFLPDRLREHLGLEDNQRRYARDAYALEILRQTRDDLFLIVGRRDEEGNPLLPSRLLFATDPKRVARRVLGLYKDRQISRPQLLGSAFDTDREASDFNVPRPKPLAAPITSMRVTDFRGYLACPYRFYLSHILKLQPVDDQAEELDALQFGNLIHDALHHWGQSDVCSVTGADEIKDCLFDFIDQHQSRWPKDARPAAFSVQLRQAKLRLEAFADWQADRARSGWQVVHTEVSPSNGHCAIDVDGIPMQLRGRIDRIDRHENGSWMVFDYKTSATAKTPAEDHLDGGGWVNLQLPLYRHIAATLHIDGGVGLGYINLPKDVVKTGESVAEWTERDLVAADQVARDVVRAVRAEEFWPPAPTPDYAEDFAPICMDTVFESPRSLRQEEQGHHE